MGDVTASEFYRVMREQTAELTKLIKDSTGDIAKALEDHKAEDRRIAELVLQIKTQRDEEAKQAAKTTTIIAMLVTTGFSAAWHVVEKMWK